MGKVETSSVAEQARSLLHLFHTLSEVESVRYADDVLTYFRKLHDHYRITKSTSPQFSGTTFIILEEIMYELEARPDETLRSPDFRGFILSVLEDIVRGRIQIASKQKYSDV